MTTKEAETTEFEKKVAIARLTEKKGEYVERLDIGGAKIEEARGQGKDVTKWEIYWCELLKEYEAVCDEIRFLEKPGA